MKRLRGNWLQQCLGSIIWNNLRLLSDPSALNVGNVIAKRLLRDRLNRLGRASTTTELARDDLHWPTEDEGCGRINVSILGPGEESGALVIMDRGRLVFLRGFQLRRLGIWQGLQCVLQSH